MKKVDLVTSLLFVPLDYCVLVAAGITSYSLRFHPWVTRYRPVFFDYPFSDFLPLVMLISLIGVIALAISGMYRISGRFRAGEIFSKAFLATSTTVLLVIVVIFLQRELFSPSVQDSACKVF